MTTTATEFKKRAAIFICLALAPVLVWYLFDVILITVGALLVATLLSLGAAPFRKIKLPYSLALMLSGLLIVSVIGGAGYLFGSGVISDLDVVLGRIEDARHSAVAAMQGSPFGQTIMRHLENANVPVGQLVGGVFRVSATFFLAILVTIFAGVYLAAQPSLYRAGIFKLSPHGWRNQMNDILDHLGDGLRLWLLGQLVQMFIIGALTGTAVLLIGLPSPLALGVIAGVLEFIPYLGPILSALPAILVAVTVNVPAVIWTIVAYLLIHQAEGQLVMPLIQRQMTYIPPAVMLLSIATITALFGWIGAIFAAPITVILFVLVSKLYVRDMLGERTSLPGEK
ncbi:AI-2E family transporter [Methylocystis sp. IM3]|uniref:AI-2E family transporter n=1 Tax=unclassified Methylocystis TaxID=2625913 RepID=UPI0030F9008E